MTAAGSGMDIWEAPAIKHHGDADGRLAGRAPRGDGADEIDGVSIEELVRCYGSPVFVLSEQRLRENRRRLHSAFEARYNRVVHGWSYKTNYTSAVCAILHQEGSWAEVVSQFEYDKARLLGVPGDRIIYNGPAKPRKAVERAVAEGARLHIDHLDEITLVEAVARAQGKVVPVTIRLNLNTGYTEPWSRFGFNLESGQAAEAAVRIRLSQHLRLEGLHCHIGTFILDPRAYARQVALMCDFMKSVEAAGETRIETIDIGGGFPSKNALNGVYLPPEQAVPDLELYADAICSALKEGLAGREGPRPTLIHESGRAVIDDAVSLVSTAVSVKRLPDGRRAAGHQLRRCPKFPGRRLSHAVSVICYLIFSRVPIRRETCCWLLSDRKPALMTAGCHVTMEHDEFLAQKDHIRLPRRRRIRRYTVAGNAVRTASA